MPTIEYKDEYVLMSFSSPEDLKGYSDTSKFEKTAKKAQKSGGHIAVDLSNIDIMDSRDIGILIYCYQIAKKNGVRYSFVNPQEQPRTAFEHANLDSIISMYSSIDELVGSL